ncbi:amino acid adenylation domain-containing protein [Nannocystaceae bacterium ST9]
MSDEPRWHELAPQQRRLWLRGAGRPLAPSTAIVELRGPVDRSRLRAALIELAGEHELLAARLGHVTGMRAPVLRLADAGAPSWVEQTIADEPERAAAWAEFSRAEPPLEAAPLRAMLIERGEQAFELWLAQPSLLADAASLLALIEALVERVAGRRVADESTSFEEYAAWQTSLLDEVDDPVGRARALAELGEWLALDRRQRELGPDLAEFEGDPSRARLELRPGPRLRDAIASGALADARLEAVLLASWRLLLARRAGLAEIVCARVVSGREFPELERSLGLLAHALPTHAALVADYRFTELWAETAAELEGLDREPLLCLREHERSTTSAGFRFERIASRWSAAGVEWRLAALVDRVEDFALALEARVHAEGLELGLIHAPSVSPTRAIWLGEALIELIEQALADPLRRLDEPSVVGERERAFVDAAMRGPAAGEPELALLHAGVERAAERWPDAIALEDDQGQLSYAALRGRVAAWAWMLRERGVGPEVVVGLCLERSRMAIVAQLAVLAAGGAFMPLDERSPAGRLGDLITRARPKLVLATRSLHERVAGSDVAVEDLDEPPWSNAPPLARAPRVRLHGANAAYVLHTSGSTGAPKPVVVEHRQICAYVEAARARLELPAGARAALVSTLAADLGNTVIWPTLCDGGRLYVPGLTRVLDPELLAEAVAGRAIEVLKIVPSHLDALLGGGRAELLPRARLVIGGEAARPGLLARVAELAPTLRVFNHYGPTEAAVGAIAGEVEPGDRERAPLGRPLAGMLGPVLDERGGQGPAGRSGELHLGGRQVARGYRGHPATTALRFVPDRFARNPGARMYRTGDRVRLDGAGRLEFLGRFDTQVKIRGHRVELGELGQALLDVPGLALRDAVVELVHEGGLGGERLAAYLVPDLAVHGPRLAALAQAQVQAWRTVFNATHGVLVAEAGVTFNAFGWDSSFTGEQLPDDHIREQVEQTVDRLRELAPSRVLELGCGTGLILFELAPECAHYFGTDMAEDVLRYTGEVLRSLPELAERVTLRKLGTDALEQIPERAFDTVIVNSVIQYFPSIDYLVEILVALIGKLEPGGRLFIGDVRSLRLLEAFHAAVELFRATPETSAATLRQRMIQQRSRERELAIDPDFWHALRDRIPAIRGVEVHLKRGRWHNELSRFRYDVILHVGEPPSASTPSGPAPEWIDLERQGATLEQLGERLAEAERRARPALAFTGLRNARVHADVALVQLLDEARARTGETLRVGELRRGLAERDASTIDPELLARLAERHGYAVNLRWSRAGEHDRFDAVLTRRGLARPGLIPAPIPERIGSLASFCNAPLLDELAGELVPRLRAALAERLPEYMQPAAFVVLPELPLTANGKLDRSRLPAPAFAKRELGETYVAPRNQLEARIAEVWREVLQVERVGIHDDFFDLGGHSLLATQVVARVRSLLSNQLPLQTFFDGPPTVARLARIVASGHADDDALEHDELVARETLGEDPRVAPLAHTQARMLFDPDPGHPFHTIPFAFHLEGELDVAALRRGLDLVLARHTGWRSVFEVGPTPAESRQRVVEVEGFPLREVDLSGSPEPEREARAIAEREGNHRFELAREIPIRGLLMRFGPDHHALCLVVHHIVSDGWSTGVFCAELSTAYRALRAGRTPELPRLPVQYGDYASWQARWLRGRRHEQQIGYWIEQLSGRALELALPTDFPRPARQTWRGAGIDVALPAGLSRAAATLASSHGASLFITLLAVYVLELHLVSGQTDIGVGTPVANRTRVELEPLLGCFINLLVIQTDLDGDPSFAELLRRVRAQCIRAYDHQDAPFHELVGALARDPGLERPPLFQVMFELANVPGERRLALEGLTLRGLDFDHGTSEFEFNLILQDVGGSLAGWLLYRTDLFGEASARALFAGFQRLLAAVVDDPNRPLSSYRSCMPAFPCAR